jgi:hypothetical protein
MGYSVRMPVLLYAGIKSDTDWLIMPWAADKVLFPYLHLCMILVPSTRHQGCSRHQPRFAMFVKSKPPESPVNFEDLFISVQLAKAIVNYQTRI